jgi:hypothetical protein
VALEQLNPQQDSEPQEPLVPLHPSPQRLALEALAHQPLASQPLDLVVLAHSELQLLHLLCSVVLLLEPPVPLEHLPQPHPLDSADSVLQPHQQPLLRVDWDSDWVVLEHSEHPSPPPPHSLVPLLLVPLLHPLLVDLEPHQQPLQEEDSLEPLQLDHLCSLHPLPPQEEDSLVVVPPLPLLSALPLVLLACLEPNLLLLAASLEHPQPLLDLALPLPLVLPEQLRAPRCLELLRLRPLAHSAPALSVEGSSVALRTRRLLSLPWSHL